MPKQAKKKAGTAKTRGRIWAIVLALLLSIGGLALAFPPQEKINQGLDIRGGMSLVLAANPSDGQEVTPEIMETAKSIIESRVNALGASEASVQVMSDNQILVQIPGMSDSTTALETIGKTGVLEFARLDSFTDETVKSNIESGDIIDYTAVNTPSGDVPTGGSNLTDYTDAKHITVEPGTYDTIFTGEHIDSVSVGRESEASANYAVNIRLDSEAASAFAEATRELYPTNGKIVIILDGEVNSAPAVQAAIMNGEVSITGGYTLEEAKALQTVLDSGSLPVSFVYEQSQTVGPTLGQGEFQAGVMAMLLGLIVVILYLLVFYRGLGLVPACSMCIFAAIYLGVLAALSAMGLFSLSLAGIAGVILSIGMAADAAILTIERFKEELKEGKSTKAASTSGVKHAMITSIDANIVSIISALALFFLASSTVKGFGLTLSIGIICNIVVILLFIGPLMRLIGPKVLRNHAGFFGVKYAIELGDVRACVNNYMTPAEVKQAKAEERRIESEKKEKAKASKKLQKERDKQADKRAKEIRKDAKRSERQKAINQKTREREMLDRIKKEDAAKDAERKQAKKTDKVSKREEQLEERRAARGKTIHVQPSDSDEKEELIEKLEAKRKKAQQPSLDDAELVNVPDADKNNDTKTVGVRKPDENEKVEHVKIGEDVEIDSDAVAEAFASIGDEDAGRGDEPVHSSEEIAAVIGNLGEYIPDDDGLEREAVDGMVMTHESADSAYVLSNRANAGGAPQGQQPMNRAQRRAAERANKKKKNNR